MAAPAILLIILASVLAIVVGILAIIYLVVPAMKGTAVGIGWVFRGIGAVIRHFYRFIAGMLTDSLRMVGLFIAGLFFIPAAVANTLIGRWSSATHFGRELVSAWGASGKALYRVCIGHPARFLLLGPMMDEIEHRVPDAVAQAPGADRPSRKTGQFDGYTIVGSLPGGGSGGRLYVAEPTDIKRAALERSSNRPIDQVVIKSFSVREGSTVPQIVRESRALEAARKLGLVLDHELTNERFFYVMPYVPGESLTLVTRRMHSDAETAGLDDRHLREAIGYIADLVSTLDVYHRGGLWHKDVKPDNIIVHDGRAELVDFGLITPLRSAMTLTTHGTEYFRDPEMVRLALRGVKVHEVDGVKFDIYGAGAVLYSVIENSFPAHGGLSQLSKRCPEALRWVVRRAMTDINTRYKSAAEMLADLRTIQHAPNAFALKPADLPSVKGGSEFTVPAPVADEFAEQMGRVAQAAAQVPPASPAPETPAAQDAPKPRTKPVIALADWWTGRYAVKSESEHRAPSPHEAPGKPRTYGARIGPLVIGASYERPERRDAPKPDASARRTPVTPRHNRPNAGAQLKSARARVQAAQRRAQDRRRGRAPRGGQFNNAPNAGVVVAVVLMLMCVVGIGGGLLIPAMKHDSRIAGAHEMSDVVAGPALHYDTPAGVATMFSDIDDFPFPERYTRTSADHDILDIAYTHDQIELNNTTPLEIRARFDEPSRLLLVINDLAVRHEADAYLNFVMHALADENMGVTEDADLVARAKTIIGLRHAADTDARAELADWLAEKVDPAIAGILWIDLDPESKEEVDRRLITRSVADTEGIVEALQTLLTW
ncbi:MAG: hypothetical protein KDA16_06800 [Phycisphaerales bacterium]|nr:hypothetical protein [Phycisphaerales bacterium]